MSNIIERVAAAPISWGVSEVDGWGHQMSSARVLTEMAELGIAATEFGSIGFLPNAPADRTAVLDGYGLHAIGGFYPVLLHAEAHDPVDRIALELDAYVAAGAKVLVLAAETGVVGYDQKHVLDAAGWSRLSRNLDRIVALAADRGVRAVLHPHVGTMVETADDVDRVLNDTSAGLCLDTGHLLIGGADPVAIVREYASRIGHTHLKDVRQSVVRRVQSGEITYTQGIHDGMYVPLGEGEADIAGIITLLGDAGYDGWYVMEQDAILTSEPDDEGPLRDVRASLDFLKGL